MRAFVYSDANEPRWACICARFNFLNLQELLLGS